VSPDEGRARPYVPLLGCSGSSLDAPGVRSGVAVEDSGSSKTSPDVVVSVLS
jgi:hypothetical protein